MILVANIITVARVAFALMCAGMLMALPGDAMRIWAIILTIWVMYMDALDGYLARALRQATKFGGTLDIACDRAVEMIYAITFCALGWVAIWLPLLFLIRGTLVDAVRSLASERGYTAFGASTMMRSRIGKALVASTLSRGLYNSTKILTYCLLIAAHTEIGISRGIPLVADCFVYLLGFFCVVRGLPVIMDGGNIFVDASMTGKQSSCST